MRKATENWKGGVSLRGRLISNLRYADDTTIMASSEEEMEELLRRIEDISTELGLKLNKSKCVLMIIDRAKTLPPLTLLNDIRIKDELIYLGAQICNKGGSEREIRRRIGMAKSALAKLTKVWKDHKITKNTKLRLVRTLIFPIATYGAEIWTMNAAGRKKIKAFEIICYRRMMRIPYTAHRTNVSILQELSIDTNNRLLLTIQKQILRFFGHVIRKDGMENLVIQGKVGRRRRGRSSNRYVDQIVSMINFTVPEMMRGTEDRELWRVLSAQRI